MAMLLLAGCDSDPGEKARSLLACEHFDNVAKDVREGVLTAPELRDKLQEIDNDARVAPEDVKAAARAMLGAATQNNPTALIAAGLQMDAACQAHGHSSAAS